MYVYMGSIFYSLVGGNKIEIINSKSSINCYKSF